MKIMLIDSDQELLNFKNELGDLIMGPPFAGDPEHDPPLVKRIVTVEWSPWIHVETPDGLEFLILVKRIWRPHPFPLRDRIRRLLTGNITDRPIF